MDEKIKEIIELGIVANGGEEWRKNWCQCDPSVGAVPCEYCAIFRALNKAKELLSLLSEEEKHEEDYQRIMKEILPCNPIPAGEREDDTLEPPWDVVARIRKELEKTTDAYLQYVEMKQVLELKLSEKEKESKHHLEYANAMHQKNVELLTILKEKEKGIEELSDKLHAISFDLEKYEEGIINLEARIKELERGIGEVLDGTLPYLTEQRLKKLIENGIESNCF